MKIWTGATIPNGWFLCDGRAISRQTYKALFAVIGTTYGSGDGNSTFNLPDMRDRFPQGANGNLGESIAAGLPNIKFEWSKYNESRDNHLVGVTTSQVSGEYGGAFDRQNRIRYKNTALAALGETKLDGTLQNDVYGKSDTVQPPAVAINYIIKY